MSFLLKKNTKNYHWYPILLGVVFYIVELKEFFYIKLFQLICETKIISEHKCL